MQIQSSLGLFTKRMVSGKAGNGLKAPVFSEQTPQGDRFVVSSKASSKPVRFASAASPVPKSPINFTDTVLVTKDTEPELDKWQKILWKKALDKGLDPYPVLFWKMDRHNLIQTAARSGFQSRYNHWSFGQEYEDLLLPQKHSLSTLYELVINNDPSHAYLLSENPLYAQKMVIAHVYGHSDFFKNNVEFSKTYRGMIDRMGAHARTIEQIRRDNNISFEEMEKFIEKSHSVQNLIDFSVREPRELQFEKRKVEPLPPDWGVVDVSHLPESVQRLYNNPAEIARAREAEMKRRQEAVEKTPQYPHADVVGYLIEQSTGMKDWQRQVLSIVRNENHYFIPQMKTKIMNEGWATFWHRRIMREPDVWPIEDSVDLLKLMAGGEAPQKYQINPYQLGRAIFEDIVVRWNKGQHGEQWEGMTDRQAKASYDDKSMKGLEKAFEVRSQYNDLRFIQDFLTEDLVRQLKLYTWEVDDEDHEGNPLNVVITSKDVDAIKKKIVAAYQNCGNPLIRVVDGNFRNRGDLLLKHDYLYELKKDYAEETLKNLFDLWGRPVHLDTRMDDKPVRLTIQKSTVVNSGGAKDKLVLTYHKLDEATGVSETANFGMREWEMEKS